MIEQSSRPPAGGVAFVLPGGGANGALQAGALYRAAELGISPSAGIAGISVGSVNGVLAAQGRWEDLRRVWWRIRTRDVYRPYNLAGLAARAAWARLRKRPGPRALWDWSPLWRMMLREAAGRRFVYRLEVGVVSLDHPAEAYRTYRAGPGSVDPFFLRAAFASGVQPVLGLVEDLPGWPAACDGGVWNVTPIGDVLRWDPARVIILDTGPHELGAGRPGRWLVDDLVRVLDLLLAGRVHVDLERALRINELVAQAEASGAALRKRDGTPYRRFDFTHVTMPATSWDSMDFDRGIRERWEIGYERARAVLG